MRGAQQKEMYVCMYGELQEVTRLPSMLETWFLFKTQVFFGMGNHLKPFPEASD